MRRFITGAVLVLLSASSMAQADLKSAFDEFQSLYETRFGQVRACTNSEFQRFGVCSPALRNDGNAPYILHHGKATQGVVVLLHGLSDSPFYMKGIAQALHDRGLTVIVPLNVGHGQLDASDEMSDSELSDKWAAHLSDVVDVANTIGDTVYLGGFSTGGALSVQYYLSHPENVDAIMLFSGALALDSGVERLSKIWGIQWVASLIDGDYVTQGPNPYKYPTIASFTGLELMEVIADVRDQFEDGKTINVPVFTAHSQADTTTPISGIEDLMARTTTKINTQFVIDESYHLCHADVVVSKKMVIDMHFDKSAVDLRDACAVPQGNPLFRLLLMMLNSFIDEVERQDEKAVDSTAN